MTVSVIFLQQTCTFKKSSLFSLYKCIHFRTNLLISENCSFVKVEILGESCDFKTKVFKYFFNRDFMTK